MPDRSCRDSVPRLCAQAFAEIRQTLGRIQAITEATHAQAAKTNGYVADLFAAGAARTAELARLKAELQHVQARQREQDTLTQKVLTAGWRLAVMLAGIVASLLGIKQALK